MQRAIAFATSWVKLVTDRRPGTVAIAILQ